MKLLKHICLVSLDMKTAVQCTVPGPFLFVHAVAPNILYLPRRRNLVTVGKLRCNCRRKDL